MSTRCNKHIVIGISGGIAAYKALTLIRLFKSNGFEVKVVATQNALSFVTKLSIETLSQNNLYYTFEHTGSIDVGHVSLAEWADAVVIAPATANIIGKLANGIADDPLSTFLLANNKPLFFAPAMNTNMYEHPAVQENIIRLKKRGAYCIDAQSGFLACGTDGSGRMEEPEKIFSIVSNFLNQQNQWNGKEVVITAGPTYEPIDPVRFIGNYSSGLMGFALANCLASQGAHVTLIAGPTAQKTDNQNITRIDVATAHEMFEATIHVSQKANLMILAAAVADYTPKVVAPEKIKKNNSEWAIEVVKTTDILAHLGKNKKEGQVLIGFALETENELQNAKLKLQNKNADAIVLNSAKNKNTGFKSQTNQVTIITKDGDIIEGKLKDKNEVASDIIDFILKQYFK